MANKKSNQEGEKREEAYSKEDERSYRFLGTYSNSKEEINE